MNEQICFCPEILDRWTAQRVFDKCKDMRLTDREALAFLKISPSDYEALTSRNSPQMEREFLLSAIKMFQYYNILQMNLWFEKALELSSMCQFLYDQNLKALLSSVTPQRPKSDQVSPKTQAIREAISIPAIAKRFGLEFNKQNKISCPFHADGTPSLVCYPDTNSFFCFGCRASGDVIEFYRRLREVKHG